MKFSNNSMRHNINVFNGDSAEGIRRSKTSNNVLDDKTSSKTNLLLTPSNVYTVVNLSRGGDYLDAFFD